jgi:hypothetical protein
MNLQKIKSPINANLRLDTVLFQRSYPFFEKFRWLNQFIYKLLKPTEYIFSNLIT